ETRNPKPETRNPKPETRNPKPETRNPKPETRKQEGRMRGGRSARACRRPPRPQTTNGTVWAVGYPCEQNKWTV
ncbi:hypothetical protein T484DRAFT_3627992, partial [Baffinella frigidus]